MNATEPMITPARGFVDGDGRLVDADQRLHDLNARAGGKLGGPLAVPQIATLTRLAQRLGILISRNVLAADGDDDLDLWVRAEPEGDGVRLSVTGWRPRVRWQSPTPDRDRDSDLVRSAADWWWETDAALRLTFISPGIGAQDGFDRAALLGQPMTRLFVLDDGAVTGRSGDAANDHDFPILAGLALQRRFDDQAATLRGTTTKLRLSATPRIDAAGAFAGFVGGVRVVQANAVQPSEGDAAQVFASRLDGALRIPLGRIIANADSISAKAEGPLRQDYADYASDIASAGRHLLGLVDDLVDLQAIEQPAFTVLAEKLDLADVARRAAGLLAVRAAEANVRIDRPGPDDRLMAMGEFRRVLQVLVNLIGNAVRFSPRDGMIWVRTEQEGDHVVIVVADQGKGIAPEDHARIFEKFARIDPHEPGGSGLGLYIARRLARAMGGDVTVDSAPGQGARFVLTLPRCAQDPPASA